MNDLLYTVKWHHQDDAAFSAHQQQLRKLIELGNPLKSGPWGEGAYTDVIEIVTLLCGVCKDIGRYRCEGRSNWQLPCALIADSKR